MAACYRVSALDKGYDITWVYRLLLDAGFTPHVRGRREEIVQRTHSWMNRFRALLVRWDKQTSNYEGGLHLACAYISFARAGLLG